VFEFKQEISKEIFFRKYALHGEKSVEEVLRGIAEEVASVELSPTDLEKAIKADIKPPKYWADKFYNAMITGEFIPGGRILANARPDSLMKNYNNCFTIDVEDSMEGIYDALKEDALIGKVGGGVGFNVSGLRPKGASISKGGESSGVMSFLEVFDASAKAIHTGGGRRCLPKGTRVHVKDGLKNIEDVRIGDKVLTADGYERVANFFEQGEQETIVIHTANGNFECTPNHKMAVFDGCFSYAWKEAKDLKRGDRLVYVGEGIEGQKTELPEWRYEKPEGSTTSIDITVPELDKNIAWLFGVIFGDGYVYLNEKGTKGNISISCGNDTLSILDKAESQLKRFNVSVFPKKVSGEYSVIRAYSNQLATYFRQFKAPNEPLTIPDFIANGTTEIRASFIAGVFDADGSCKNRSLNVVSTIYENFAKQMVDILNSLGIPSSLKMENRENKGHNNMWLVNLSNAVSVRSWDEVIAPHSEKYFKIRTRKGFYQSGVYDFSWDGEMFLKEGIKYRRLWDKKSKSIKLTTLERVIEKKLNLYPVEVEGVSDGELIETFDIEVENRHEFVANGFLTHNSAHLAVLNIDHPDIEEFIEYKEGGENGKLTQFNISVGITDRFMDRLKEDEDMVFISLDDGSAIKLHKDEKIEIDGQIFTAGEYERISKNGL
jgi:intein/homing endonuclease